MAGNGMSRRGFIGSVAAAAAVGAAWLTKGNSAAAAERFEVARLPQEWRRILSPQAYAVLREGHTERAGSSPLDKEKRRGVFACAGCALPLYASAAKFESGTGWP